MSLSQPEQTDNHFNQAKIIIAIPARIGSTRLRNKPLALLGGRPLIAHVAERVTLCLAQIRKSFGLAETNVSALVATDSPEIQAVLSNMQLPVIMTPSNLPSGTDRVEHALRQQSTNHTPSLSPDTLIINLQGDEPFFCFEDVLTLCHEMLQNSLIPMATLAYKNTSPNQFLTPSSVKVVRNHSNDALYFSRSPLPWPRAAWGASQLSDGMSNKQALGDDFFFLHHIGVYAFRYAALQSFTAMAPGELELTEGLEQLRALEAGWRIRVVDAHEAPFGIDTESDLLRAEEHLNSRKDNA
jgi:3-deoxy-manno-octulosonate cytidylyltransferase (CMP-KDO synthetase)